MAWCANEKRAGESRQDLLERADYRIKLLRADASGDDKRPPVDLRGFDLSGNAPEFQVSGYLDSIRRDARGYKIIRIVGGFHQEAVDTVGYPSKCQWESFGPAERRAAYPPVGQDYRNAEAMGVYNERRPEFCFHDYKGFRPYSPQRDTDEGPEIYRQRAYDVLFRREGFETRDAGSRRCREKKSAVGFNRRDKLAQVSRDAGLTDAGGVYPYPRAVACRDEAQTA